MTGLQSYSLMEMRCRQEVVQPRWWIDDTNTTHKHVGYILPMFVRIYDLKDASVISVNLPICVLWCMQMFLLRLCISPFGDKYRTCCFHVVFIGHFTYFGGKVTECHRWWMFTLWYYLLGSFLGNQMNNVAVSLHVSVFICFLFQYWTVYLVYMIWIRFLCCSI